MNQPTEPHRSPAFERNLNALHGSDPGLAERLCLPVDGSHVKAVEGGPPVYKVHRYFYPFVVPAERQDTVLSGLDGSRQLLLFGAGVGELLEAALQRHPEVPVVVWDRDPWLLRWVLGRLDLTDRIANGQVQLKLGIDLLDLLEDPGDRIRIDHPFLGEVYRFERTLLDRGLGEGRALLRAGTLFVDDLARALAHESYSIYTLDTDRLSREELEYTVRRFRPDLLAAINYSEGTAEFCRDVGCDLMCWEIDPSTSRMRPLTGPSERAHVFTYRRANVELFRNAGFGRVEYLPLAADTRHRRPLDLDPEDLSEYGAPVTYVGASMVAEGLEFRDKFLTRYAAWATARGSDPAVGATLLGRVLGIQRQDLSRYRVEELLGQLGGSFLADERGSDDPEDPAMLVAEIAASEKRLTYVANLASSGIVVWGDKGWSQVERFGARYSGRYARHTDELTKVYNASTINVDIGRLYQSDIVTMRVFDVLACGGFLLAEYSEALEEVFALGEEVECYQTLDELRAKVSYYLRRPDEAASIARRGLEAVRERHSIAARVRHMLDRMGRPPGSGGS